ncbi:MAG: hypothetical protein QMD14_03680, partial [Candidatus Aenigmarchaeota archaeon]|nr:hypothetical protein [Candidatus Aenigmarchaeota archaeon]
HRSPHYPGTGLRSEANCFNYPLPAYAGDEMYLETLDRALEEVDLKGIEIIGISAGFDAHREDMMASLGLTSECYREIGKRTAKLGLPVFVTLEGGYIGRAVGMSIDQLIQGLEG